MKELRPAYTDSVWKVALWVSMAGFAVLHLAADPRSRDAWAAVSARSLAGVTIIAVPAAIVSLLTDEPLASVLADSDINSGDPAVLRNVIFVSPERNRIRELADGSNFMHPSLLLDPVIATAFLIGLPILLWRVRTSLAARLLLGTLCVTLVVVYVPPITHSTSRTSSTTPRWRSGWRSCAEIRWTT
jgi:hypothetical protein